MTGCYLIYVPADSTPNEKYFDTNWRKFVTVCRSLDQDGLEYDVKLNLTDSRPNVVITATGSAKPRKVRAVHRLSIPPNVPVQRCRDRAREVSWFLPENHERRNGNTTYWGRHQARYQELSGMAEEFLRADLEYWQELESLSRQRQHFKPGRTDETANADDEVVAA
jgi:hypothetical protein